MTGVRWPGRAGGFSLLELVVVISLIGILLVVALWRLTGFVQEAERVAVLTVEGEMRNVLVMEMAKRILNPGGPTVLSLADSNPMDLMLETPVNYLGPLGGRMAIEVPPRHWFFDVHNKHLVYRTGGKLTDRTDLTHDIRYEVRISYSDLDGDGDFSAVRDRLHGVRLHRLGGDGWLSGHYQARRDDSDWQPQLTIIARTAGYGLVPGVLAVKATGLLPINGMTKDFRRRARVAGLQWRQK